MLRNAWIQQSIMLIAALACAMYTLLGPTRIAAVVLKYQSFLPGSQVKHSVSWEICSDTTPSGHAFECGRLLVPLEYGNPGIGEASLSIMRLRTDAKRRRGSLFTNPGGPGVSGTGDFHRERSQDIMEQTGGHYDIISWDLRGINDTIPSAKCFESQQSADDFWAGSLWYEGVETNSSLESAFDREKFYDHVNSEDIKIRAFWKQCESRSGNILPYIGTAATARDVASMLDAIDGPDAEINFWGFSAGSVIGQNIISIFPDRVGKIILDGVVYGPRWSAEPAVELFNKLLTDTDSTYFGFAELCALAGPEGCALASPGSTTDSILAGIDRLLQNTYDPHGNLDNSLSRSSSFKAEIFMALQAPQSKWQPLARYLKAQQDLSNAENDDEKAAIKHTWEATNQAMGISDGIDRHDLKRFWDFEFFAAYFGITCSDAANSNGTTTRDIFDTVIRASKLSTRFGSMWPTEGGWPCHHWKTRAVERVTDFRFVSLITRAREDIINQGLELDLDIRYYFFRMSMTHFVKGDAGLGIRSGYGHCSYTEKSTCLTRIIQAYLDDWTLPPDAMSPCEAEENFFPRIRQPRGPFE